MVMINATTEEKEPTELLVSGKQDASATINSVDVLVADSWRIDSDIIIKKPQSDQSTRDSIFDEGKIPIGKLQFQ